jgi:cellulose synthase/poly-beta-1,6-N-acetylglucosamine synthase-like glycosyltransferase
LPRDKFEIIIVDGDSKDKTTEIATKHADKVIRQTSHGVGGARNDGAFVAEGEIIVTTDADCLPDEEWLNNLLKDFEDDRIVAVTGYLDPMIPEEMDDVQAKTYKTLFWIANGLRRAGAKIGYYHLCGANTAFRREAFTKIRGYSDLAYSDDVEIAKRLRPLGKMKMNRKAEVDYSIRRIAKLGLLKYSWMIIRNDFIVMILGKKPKKGSYAKQNYG